MTGILINIIGGLAFFVFGFVLARITVIHDFIGDLMIVDVMSDKPVLFLELKDEDTAKKLKNNQYVELKVKRKNHS